MITREQAIALRPGDMLHETGCRQVVGPRGGVTVTINRWRVNGQPRTWKRDPERYEVPIKYGLRCYDTITPSSANLVHLESECPLTARFHGPCDWSVLYTESCDRMYMVNTLGAYNFCDEHQAKIDANSTTVAALFKATR